MICINLLPWRESKLKQLRKKLVLQLLVTVLFPCLATTLYRNFEQARVMEKNQSILAIKQLNQQVLIKIESLNSGLLNSENNQAKHQHLIHIINQKNRLPEILAFLTREKRTGQINELLLDHQTLKITYASNELNDTLALFQLLNSHPAFCHVSYEPAQFSKILKDTQQQGALSQNWANYEFNASLCDIATS